jgi:hypothetical protein
VPRRRSFVASGSPRSGRLPTVHSIDNTPRQQEPTMNTAFTAQATAFGLAAIVTLGLLVGLNGLAHTEYQAAQQLVQVAAAAPRA